MTLADPTPAAGPDSALTLSDLCQQNITVLDDAGGLFYKQPDNSCMCGPPAGHPTEVRGKYNPCVRLAPERLWPALALEHSVPIHTETWFGGHLTFCQLLLWIALQGRPMGAGLSAYMWL